MSPEDKKTIGEEVLSIIERDIHGNFSEAYAIVVSTTEKIPQQANNEIRNAVNHLARAYASDCVIEARKNIAQAKGHIERGMRDCFKIAIIGQRRFINGCLSTIEAKYGFLPDDIVRKLRVIEKRRKKLLEDEARGEEEISSNLENVLSDYCELIERMLDAYSIPGAPTKYFWRGFRFLRRHCYGVGMGVLASLIAAFIFSYYFPNSADAHDLVSGILGTKKAAP